MSGSWNLDLADIPEPFDNSIKEVYAFYGRASYCAQVFEKGLVNMMVAFKINGVEHDSGIISDNAKLAGIMKIID